LKFEVAINGVVQCVAESAELGTLSAILSYVHVRRDPQYFTANEIARAETNGEPYSDHMGLYVGGLDSNKPSESSAAHFVALDESVNVGDIVSIRILA
jgi:hypothetical protein